MCVCLHVCLSVSIIYKILKKQVGYPGCLTSLPVLLLLKMAHLKYIFFVIDTFFNKFFIVKDVKYMHDLENKNINRKFPLTNFQHSHDRKVIDWFISL